MKKMLIGLLAIMMANAVFSQIITDLNELTKHVGDSVKAQGKVFSTRYFPDSKNAPTLINIGAAYPNQILTVVIYGDDRKNFKNPPEDYFKGKEVIISGKVELYHDKPQIVVKDYNGVDTLQSVREIKN